MTEEATNSKAVTMLPFRFAIEFLQELDGIVLAESREDAEEDIREKGGMLPNFVLKQLDELSAEEYKELTKENSLHSNEVLN